MRRHPFSILFALAAVAATGPALAAQDRDSDRRRLDPELAREIREVVRQAVREALAEVHARHDADAPRSRARAPMLWLQREGGDADGGDRRVHVLRKAGDADAPARLFVLEKAGDGEDGSRRCVIVRKKAAEKSAPRRVFVRKVTDRGEDVEIVEVREQRALEVDSGGGKRIRIRLGPDGPKVEVEGDAESSSGVWRVREAGPGAREIRVRKTDDRGDAGGAPAKKARLLPLRLRGKRAIVDVQVERDGEGSGDARPRVRVLAPGAGKRVLLLDDVTGERSAKPRRDGDERTHDVRVMIQRDGGGEGCETCPPCPPGCCKEPPPGCCESAEGDAASSPPTAAPRRAKRIEI